MCTLRSFLFVFLVLSVSAGGLQAQNPDISILRKINPHRNTRLDPSFRFLSNTMIPVSCAMPLSLICAGLNNQDPVLTKKGLVCGASFLLSTAVTLTFKYSVKRKRPFAVYEDIQRSADAGPYSFPSGHTSSAFATATALSLAFPKWYVVAPSFVWASAVAFSRLHLGVHYPTDVIAGILIGVGSSLLCHESQYWVKK
jgi:membrane-associated phospholipid phosphatase